MEVTKVTIKNTYRDDKTGFEGIALVEFDGCLSVDGFKIVKSKFSKNVIIFFPSVKSKNGSYYPTISASRELKLKIEKEIKEKYEKNKNNKFRIPIQDL